MIRKGKVVGLNCYQCSCGFVGKCRRAAARAQVSRVHVKRCGGEIVKKWRETVPPAGFEPASPA